jgi:hypothetical protein
VIDSIQIHGYARNAKEVKDKIQSYYTVFAEDFEGSNGRKKKTLWLTEVAMGSSDGAAISAFVHDLMNPADGLTNRSPGSSGGFGFVEKVSWFSEFFFPPFTVSGVTPAAFESWSSSLFDPYGGLNEVGEKFFGYCGNKTAVVSLMPPPLPPPAASTHAIAHTPTQESAALAAGARFDKV